MGKRWMIFAACCCLILSASFFIIGREKMVPKSDMGNSAEKVSESGENVVPDKIKEEAVSEPDMEEEELVSKSDPIYTLDLEKIPEPFQTSEYEEESFVQNVQEPVPTGDAAPALFFVVLLIGSSIFVLRYYEKIL